MMQKLRMIAGSVRPGGGAPVRPRPGESEVTSRSPGWLGGETGRSPIIPPRGQPARPSVGGIRREDAPWTSHNAASAVLGDLGGLNADCYRWRSRPHAGALV